MSLFETLAKELYDYSDEGCAHEWEYQKEEQENLDGNIVTQYHGGSYCFKCETWEDE